MLNKIKDFFKPIEVPSDDEIRRTHYLGELQEQMKREMLNNSVITELPLFRKVDTVELSEEDEKEIDAIIKEVLDDLNK